MDLELPKDFFDFLRLLHESSTEYLLIGGYAVSYYGYPRATGDMDIWIPMSEATAACMVEVFKDLGSA